MLSVNVEKDTMHCQAYQDHVTGIDCKSMRCKDFCGNCYVWKILNGEDLPIPVVIDKNERSKNGD